MNKLGNWSITFVHLITWLRIFSWFLDGVFVHLFEVLLQVGFVLKAWMINRHVLCAVGQFQAESLLKSTSRRTTCRRRSSRHGYTTTKSVAADNSLSSCFAETVWDAFFQLFVVNYCRETTLYAACLLYVIRCATAWNGHMTSPAVWGLLEDSSRL